jgi:hypothetical protein
VNATQTRVGKYGTWHVRFLPTSLPSVAPKSRVAHAPKLMFWWLWLQAVFARASTPPLSSERGSGCLSGRWKILSVNSSSPLRCANQCVSRVTKQQHAQRHVEAMVLVAERAHPVRLRKARNRLVTTPEPPRGRAPPRKRAALGDQCWCW